MLGLFAMLVFAIAGCTSAAVIGSSLRSALPALRRMAEERRALVEDRFYLFTPTAAAMAVRAPVAGVVRRRAVMPVAADRLRAAA